MRIAVCDDIKFEREELVKILCQVLKEASIDEFNTGKELLQSHELQHYDLIFLDILMPEKSGLDIAAELRKNDTKTPIVFVSVSEEFGVQSYRVQAFDYLLKPVDAELLKTCINRLLSGQKKKEYITVNYSGIETKVLLSNIQCLESNLRKVVFTLTGSQTVEICGKLTDFAVYLLSHGFVRCHKSYLVNMEHIAGIDESVFRLTGGKQIKISRAYLQEAKKAYFDYIFSREA